jgi:hypothetical protein
MKSCGGLSDVHLHAPEAHMQVYETAKEAEQLFNNDLSLTAPNLFEKYFSYKKASESSEA